MLNIDPFTILWTLIDLLILFVLMKKFLFKPINAILDSRAKAIEENMNQAESQRREAEELKAQYEEQLAQTRQQAGEILAKAQAQGEALYQKSVSDAQAEAKKLLSDGAKRNAHDREVMLKSLREEVASLVVEAAAKVAERDSDCIDNFLREEGEAK